MSKNIGKIIRVNSLPPKDKRLTNVIYQVAVPETATYIDYAVDENGDIKTPTLDKSFTENDFSKVKTVNHQEPDENGNIALNDYVQIYNSDEELQEIWDNGISDKVYFNHHTKEMVIGNSDGDGYSLFKMEEYLNKPDVTGTVQEYPYVVVVDNEGNSAKRSLEDLNTNNLISVDQANTIVEDEFSIKTDTTTLKFDFARIVTTYESQESNNIKAITSIGSDEGIPFYYESKDNNGGSSLELNTSGIGYLIYDSAVVKQGFLSYPNMGQVTRVIPVKINDTYANEAGEININRFPDLEDKTQDATYNRTMVTDSQGKLAYAPLLASEFLRYEENSNVGFGLKFRKDNPTFYNPIGRNAIDMAIGHNPVIKSGASGEYSVTVGFGSLADKNNSLAIGFLTAAIGGSSTAIGSNMTASGGSSVAIGNQGTASGSFSVVIGANTASGYGSTSIGISNVSSSKYTYTMGGKNITAAVFKSVVMGFSNPEKPTQSKTAWVPTDDLFVIGNGNDDITPVVKSEALNIKKNGHATLPSVNNTIIDTDNKSIITKEYLDIRIPKPPTTGNHVLKAVNGVVSWVTE